MDGVRNFLKNYVEIGALPQELVQAHWIWSVF